jgi:hypothetical protein
VQVFIAPLARYRDVIVVRETYRDKGDKRDEGFTNSLYELDCGTRTLRYIGGEAGDERSIKDSEFYSGAYTKAHDALCNKYKDTAEWSD